MEGVVVIRKTSQFVVSVCLSLTAFPHYCTHPDVTRGMVAGAR